MTVTEPRLVAAPDTVWRVARLGKGTEFSQIDPVDALSLNAGNRFDVVGGGVLYASTLLEGCYREVLARLRPAPGMIGLDEDDSRHMRAGNVAASWRENRRRFALGLPDALPFVDVEHQDTWNTLEAAIAMPAGVHHLDVTCAGPTGSSRGPSRLGSTHRRTRRALPFTPACAICRAPVTSSAGRSSTALPCSRWRQLVSSACTTRRCSEWQAHTD